MAEVEAAGDGVWVIRLQHPQQEQEQQQQQHWANTFDPRLVQAVHDALDRVLREAADGPCAVVISGGRDNKFFSNGHDVQWLERAASEHGLGPESPALRFIADFYKLLLRFMRLPVVTVAAVNGHAFAGGCLLALAQDYRVMRADKGFMCMNEIDMALMATPEQAAESHVKPGVFPNADAKMTAVLQAKLPPLLVREMFLEGKRYTGKAAADAGIVDHAVEGGDGVLQAAIELARKHAPKGVERNRRTVHVLKSELVRSHAALLSGDLDNTSANL